MENLTNCNIKDTTTLIAEIDDAINDFKSLVTASNALINLKPETKLYEKILIKISTGLKSEELPFSVTQMDAFPYAKLSDILRDAELTNAEIAERESNSFNSKCIISTWFIKDFHEVDLFLKSALKYIDNQMPNFRQKKCIANIIKRCTKNKAGTRILPTVGNLRLIFGNDPNLKDLIAYDHFIGNTIFLKCAPWHNQKYFTDSQNWADVDTSRLKIYLRENYMEFVDPKLEDFLIEEAYIHEFNRVQQFIETLPAWDGVPRAEEIFIKYLQVDDTPFAREVTLNWLLGAMARIYHPGCSYQNVLILHGNQGIGKSHIIEKLGGAFYIALQDAVDDNHAEDAVKNAWIVELKELASLRKAELNRIKAFVESSEATRRFAYDKNTTTRKRHCVFVGTVNDDEFLRDQTGNRRYKILHCNLPREHYIEGLTDEIVKQIWAEVYVKYCEMFKYRFDETKLQLSAEAKIESAKIEQNYLQDDGLLSEVKAFVDKKIPPQFIWQLMTKDERQKFFVEGKITFEQTELNNRARAEYPKAQAQEVINQIYSFLEGNNPFTRKETITRAGKAIDIWHIYGAEQRMHICAAEVYNEYFNSDRRATIYKINELLPKLDGWTLGQRFQKKDKVYTDQKKVYCRQQ